MRYTRKETSAAEALVMILFLIVILPILMWQAGKMDEKYQNDIRSWATQHGYVVQSIHPQGVFEGNGPWTFRGKGVRIYDTTTTDSKGHVRHVWMRTGTIFRDAEYIEQ